jgi:hypothetical protein
LFGFDTDDNDSELEEERLEAAETAGLLVNELYFLFIRSSERTSTMDMGRSCCTEYDSLLAIDDRLLGNSEGSIYE